MSQSLLDVLDELKYVNNIVQIRIDGPDVNWKLLDIKQDRSNKNPRGLKMLGFGSCVTHVIHGAFGTAKSAADWNLKMFLKNCHSIFKKSFARRSVYFATNKLQSSHEGKGMSYLFPLKFCGYRWLVNTNVICRILEIFPYLQKYFKGTLRQIWKLPIPSPSYENNMLKISR